MTIIAIGDIHLEKLNGAIPGALRLQLDALRRILRYGYQSGARHAVLLGDVFDTAHPRQSTQVALADVLNTFDMTYHVIPGNHDRPEIDVHGLEVFEWIFKKNTIKGTFYDEPTLAKIDGHRYWMCPHPFIEDQPSRAILSFGHFAWKGAKRDNGTKHPGGSMPKGTWVLGDFHEPQSGKRYTYAGSITQTSFGETPNKGYLKIDGKDVQFVKIKPSYLMEQASASCEGELKALAGGKRDGIPVYYSVDFSDGFIPHAGWQKRYPHIMPRRYTGKKRDADASSGSSARFILSMDPLDGLSDWLAGKDELTKAGRKWAMAKAKTYEARARV